MDEQLKQIGERLRGLRDVLDIPVSEMAETIGISADKYEKIEQGELEPDEDSPQVWCIDRRTDIR